MEGKGGLKEKHCIAQNAALFVDIIKYLLCQYSKPDFLTHTHK